MSQAVQLSSVVRPRASVTRSPSSWLVLAHAYLGTVANPGTWRVLVDGWVTREWAKHHHPNWYKKIMEEDAGESTTGGQDNASDADPEHRK